MSTPAEGAEGYVRGVRVMANAVRVRLAAGGELPRVRLWPAGTFVIAVVDEQLEQLATTAAGRAFVRALWAVHEKELGFPPTVVQLDLALVDAEWPAIDRVGLEEWIGPGGRFQVIGPPNAGPLS